MVLILFFLNVFPMRVLAFALPGTGLNMTGSLYSVDVWKGEFLDVRNLILPVITLMIRPLSVIVQLTRSSLLDVMQQDYIRTARAKGLSEWEVIFRHALRNALNPVITAVSGWFASLLAGAIFVEFVFGWKGLGQQMFTAIENQDMPVVMGGVIVISVAFVLINILVDLLYAWIDPRVRLS
jgi:peptide/nickel transport system permease protein